MIELATSFGVAMLGFGLCCLLASWAAAIARDGLEATTASELVPAAAHAISRAMLFFGLLFFGLLFFVLSVLAFFVTSIASAVNP